MAPKISSSKHHIEYFDGLRGYAALMVFNHHILTNLYALGLSQFSPIFNLVLQSGKLAVVIFFVLSGRIIANSILRNPTTKTLIDTSIRRIFRIAIPVLCIWVFHWFCYRVGFYNFSLSKETVNVEANNRYVSLLKDLSRPYNLSTAFKTTWNTFVNSVSNDDRIQLKEFRPAWTLVVELQCSFYLYVFAMISTKLSLGLKIALYTVALSFYVFSNDFLACFIFGLMLSELGPVLNVLKSKRMLSKVTQFVLLIYILFGGIWLQDYIHNLQKTYKLIVFSTSGTIFSFLSSISFNNVFRFEINHLLVGFSLMIFLELNSTLQNILSSRFFQLLGKASFGLYTLHWFALSSVMLRLYDLVGTLRISDANIIKPALVYLGTLLYLVPLCVLFYYTADSLSIKSGRVVCVVFWKIFGVLYGFMKSSGILYSVAALYDNGVDGASKLVTRNLKNGLSVQKALVLMGLLLFSSSLFTLFIQF